MKKIIFVINYFGNGGAAMVMKSVMTELSKTNNIMLVAFIDDENIYKIPSDVEYIKLNSKMTLTKKEKMSSILKLREIIKRNTDAIIISFEYFINIRTIIAMFGLNNRLIISERNDPARVGNKHKHIRNFLYRFADVLVCQTEDAKKYFPKYIQKKTTIILNPLKKNLPELYRGRREKVIVNFCRLEKQKNLKLLIDAFNIVSKKCSDYKLYIYGDGNAKEDIIDYIKSKKIDKKVFIFPFDNNIHDKIKNYTMYVSSSDYEGLSNSMLEAMAIGLPTICTDCPCGGARMVIKDGYNGFLTNVNDVNMLSDLIIRLLNNEKLRQKLSYNAIEIRNVLSINNIVKEWEKIL